MQEISQIVFSPLGLIALVLVGWLFSVIAVLGFSKVAVFGAKKARDTADYSARKTVGIVGRFIKYLKRIYKEEVE